MSKDVPGTFADFYAGPDLTCCICNRMFPTRLRLIAHLTEKRKRGNRTPCGSLLEGKRPFEAETVAKLDALDTESRKKARRLGRTQPVVGGCGLKRVAVPEQPAHPTKRRRLSKKTPPASLP